jgi:hypothetical protein
MKRDPRELGDKQCSPENKKITLLFFFFFHHLFCSPSITPMTVPRKSHSKESKTMLLIIFLIAEENKASANLDNFLSHRPAPQELVDRNIMKGKKKKKPREKTRPYIKHILSLFLLLDPKLAPSLQQQAENLAKQKVQDSLRHKIDHRPTREELIEHNILKGKIEREDMPLV